MTNTMTIVTWVALSLLIVALVLGGIGGVIGEIHHGDCKTRCQSLALPYYDTTYAILGGTRCICGNLTTVPLEVTP